MTAHIAQSSARCGTSQTAVIIQALAPVIGPYMSRAITTIHIQETSGSRISSTTSRRAIVSQRGLENRWWTVVAAGGIGHRRSAGRQGCGAGDVGFAGDARFFEKNGSTFRSIRSPTLLV